MYILEIQQIEPKLSLRFNVDVIAIPPWLGSHDSLKFYPTVHEKGGWKLELVSIGKSHFTTISSSWQLLFWKLSLAIFHPQNRHSSDNQLLTNCFSSNTFLPIIWRPCQGHQLPSQCPFPPYSVYLYYNVKPKLF